MVLLILHFVALGSILPGKSTAFLFGLLFRLIAQQLRADELRCAFIAFRQ